MVTIASQPASACRARSSASGVGASISSGFLALTNSRVAGDRPVFPPSVAVAIKALACELPCRRGLPLSRWSVAELRHEAMASGIVAQINGTTLWRWLSQDALRPWRHRTWIFPRDPQFVRKAGRVLDLYQRRWKGAALGPRDYVLCTDEKTSIQARRRKHHSLPPAPRRPVYVEHEYARAGALAYLAAWDVHRARLFGSCERKNGIAAFERLVAQVMSQEPYRSASRVFVIADNGSSHRGRRAAARLRAKWPTIVLVHTPIHASWLNQIEVYFSIVQRKLLTPSDFADLIALKRGASPFNAAISGPPGRSSGPSRVATCTSFSSSSSHTMLHRTGRYGPGIRHRNCESGYLHVRHFKQQAQKVFACLFVTA